MSDPHSIDPGQRGPGERSGVWHAPLPSTVPEPTYAPAGLALGLLLCAWGVLTHWVMTATGAALTVWSLARWFSELRSDWKREEDPSP